MNISDASAVLTYASAGDNRTVTRESAHMWSECLTGDISVDEARRAIVHHFANSTEYLKPAHVNDIVASWRVEHARDLPPVAPPTELADEPRREIEWKRVWGDAVLAGHTLDKARQIANGQFNITEAEPPAAIEASVLTLRDASDRTQREMADRKRMAEIQAEIERQAKADRRAAQEAAEQERAEATGTNNEKAAT